MSLLRKTIKFIYHFIDKILTTITLFLIKIYQLTISPDKWIFSKILRDKVCSHIPHCSKYATQILKRYWFLKSLAPIADRVLLLNQGEAAFYGSKEEFLKKAFGFYAVENGKVCSESEGVFISGGYGNERK